MTAPLRTTALGLADALGSVKPDLDGALIRHLTEKADEARVTYEALARRCETQKWTMCQRIFPHGRTGYEERDLAREEWLEAQEELGEAMAR